MIRHPEHLRDILSWPKWRAVYEGGDAFIDAFLQKFSKRETDTDFLVRKSITPIPAFAKGSINEIKNAIFERLGDVVRVGGTKSYQAAIKGDNGGVNLRGGSMNWFLGNKILPELLVLGKVGVYIDNKKQGPTLADRTPNNHPYIYIFKAEDILSWAYNNEGNFTSVYLREYAYENADHYTLPYSCRERYRLLELITENGKTKVRVSIFDGEINANAPADQVTKPTEMTILDLPKIPFHIFELTDSLVKDIANHQIALLNLESSDVMYGLKSNFPFYVEQFDHRSMSKYLKNSQTASPDAPTAESIQENEKDTVEEKELGVAQGRRYGKDLDAPAFINPSPEPLQVSMEKQDRLKKDIRVIVHLSLSNIQAKSASAESKSFDQHGLEAGLNYIGLELENGENQIASIWSLYEKSEDPSRVTYPKTYSLRSQEDRQKEVENLGKIRTEVPSSTFQKEVSKRMAELTLGVQMTQEVAEKIRKEIDAAKGLTSNPKEIIEDHKSGLVGSKTASILRGYDAAEVERAKVDHAERLARIAEAQSKEKNQTAGDAGARGIEDQSVNPRASEEEKDGKAGRGGAK